MVPVGQHRSDRSNRDRILTHRVHAVDDRKGGEDADEGLGEAGAVAEGVPGRAPADEEDVFVLGDRRAVPLLLTDDPPDGEHDVKGGRDDDGEVVGVRVELGLPEHQPGQADDERAEVANVAPRRAPDDQQRTLLLLRLLEHLDRHLALDEALAQQPDLWRVGGESTGQCCSTKREKTYRGKAAWKRVPA